MIQIARHFIVATIEDKVFQVKDEENIFKNRFAVLVIFLT